MPVKLNSTEKNKINSKLANRGEQPLAKPWQARLHKIALVQNEVGEWRVITGKRANPLPATDYEVSLWLELQEARRQLARK